jgi:hypothetical protein
VLGERLEVIQDADEEEIFENFMSNIGEKNRPSTPSFQDPRNTEFSMDAEGERTATAHNRVNASPSMFTDET